MKKVYVDESIVYTWECPECGHFNEDCNEPDVDDEVWCSGCRETFIVTDDNYEHGEEVEDEE